MGIAVWDLNHRCSTKSSTTKDLSIMKVIGVDGYNGSITGEVSMTLTGQRIGVQNIPVVIITRGRSREMVQRGVEDVKKDRSK